MGKKSQFLTKEQIADANVLKEVEFEVPEWGGSVLLRELSGLDRDRFEGIATDPITGIVDQEKLQELQARLVQLSIIDPGTGRRMFESEKDFIQFVGRFTRDSLVSIAKRCIELNGMDDATRDAEIKKSPAESGNVSSTT